MRILRKLTAAMMAGLLLGAGCFESQPGGISDAWTLRVTAAVGDVIMDGDLRYILEEDNTLSVLRYTGTSAKIVIPETVQGYPVTQIGKCAFEENEVMTEVVLPETIVVVDYKAFSRCKNLETINFPKSLKRIEEYAFTTCHSLKAIDLSNVSYIGVCAFQLCISLTEITVSGNIRQIPDHAFHGCHSLEKLIFEEGVEKIDPEAALNHYFLREIYIPASVTTIGEHALGFEYYYPDYMRIDVKIYGYRGTEAERYAKDNGFEFVSLDPVECPDINADGEATIADAVLLTKIIGESVAPPSGFDSTAADLDEDGLLTLSDVSKLMKLLEKLN